MNSYPNTEPDAYQCPEGFKYRQPSFVTGSCVKNKKMSLLSDDRCPADMHWRNTYFLKAKCTKIPSRTFKVKLPRPALQTCDNLLTSDLFREHLKIVSSFLHEYFSVPISKDLLSKRDLLKKITQKFIKSIQGKLKDSNCVFRLTPDQQLQLNDFSIKEVYAFNKQFVSDEQWEYIQYISELDMLLYACRDLVKTSYQTNFSTLYLEQLKELRKGLVYLQQHNLLPKQNVLIAKAYYEYVSLFIDKENIHGVHMGKPPIAYEVRKSNYEKMLRMTVDEGLVNIPNYILIGDKVTLPKLQIPDQEIDVVDVDVDVTQSKPTKGPKEALTVDEIELKSNIIIPKVFTSAVDDEEGLLSQNMMKQKPPGIINQDELEELYDYHFIINQFQNTPNAKLNTKGVGIIEKHKELLTKLSMYFNNKLTPKQLNEYIENYGAELYPITFDALLVKHNGPFWETPTIYIKCFKCNTILKLPDPVPPVVQCPSCKQLMRTVKK
jgi:hypothetical protein